MGNLNFLSSSTSLPIRTALETRKSLSLYRNTTEKCDPTSLQEAPISTSFEQVGSNFCSTIVPGTSDPRSCIFSSQSAKSGFEIQKSVACLSFSFFYKRQKMGEQANIPSKTEGCTLLLSNPKRSQKSSFFCQIAGRVFWGPPRSWPLSARHLNSSSRNRTKSGDS